MAISQATPPVARIFNLNVDCFEELFEWLSLADLKSLRLTCRRFRTIVNYCIKTNYPSIRLGYGHVEIFDWTELCHIYTEFITAIHFSNRCTFRNDFIKIKGMLSQVESIKVKKDQISGEFYGNFLKFCNNLKYLSISDIYDKSIIGVDNRWLLRSYPTLEHIEIIENSFEIGQEIFELKTFFQLNQTVQSFTTTVQFLQRNGNCLKESNVKLENLTIFCNKPFEQIANLLHELQQERECGERFYKQLNLYGSYSTIVTDNLTSVHALEKLDYARVDCLLLPPLYDLKEFGIGKVEKTANLISLAKSFINVERIYIGEGTLKDVTAFICHSPKVKHIKIDRLNGGFRFNIRSINLNELNKERIKLIGAKMIRIYVAEEFFVFMKWSGFEQNFNLVEMKRTASYNCKIFR